MFRKIVSLCSICLLGIVVSAHATTITYGASGTAAGGSGPVSAQAQFVTGNGFITITLVNELSASTINDVAQAVSDLSFDLGNLTGGTLGTQGSLTASGQQGNVDS